MVHIIHNLKNPSDYHFTDKTVLKKKERTGKVSNFSPETLSEFWIQMGSSFIKKTYDNSLCGLEIAMDSIFYI
jgi:hypothetical protein